MQRFIDLLKYCPSCSHPYSADDIDQTGLAKCPNCKFKNYVKSFPTVCGIIPNHDAEILMVKRAFDPGKGEYDPPGGFVNYAESPQDAIIREIKEELGVEVQINKILNVGKTSYIQNDINYPTIVTCFLINEINPSNIKIDADENSAYKYFKIADVIAGNPQIMWSPVLDAVKIYAAELGIS